MSKIPNERGRVFYSLMASCTVKSTRPLGSLCFVPSCSVVPGPISSEPLTWKVATDWPPTKSCLCEHA